MKIFGIICEYDPLHFGHIRHINHTRKLAGTDGIIICVMSGNFLQRGLPSTMNKFTRAKHAILSGADVVIELPTLFSTSSANDFAYGGVKILNQLKCDALSCGSESGDIDALNKLSSVLLNGQAEFDNYIKDAMSQGHNYPSAISLAEEKILGTTLLKSPNNLLAIEYLKSITKLDAQIEFDTLKRDSNFADEDNLKNCSSSVIRKAFKSSNIEGVQAHMPKYVFEDIIKSEITYQTKFENIIPIILATKDKKYLADIADISEGIENLLFNNLEGDFENYLSKIKSKRYTRAKLNRILLYAVLGIDKDYQAIKQTRENLPINILAIKNDANIIQEITNRINENNLENTDITQKISLLTEKADRLYNTMYNIVIDKNKINKLNKY